MIEYKIYRFQDLNAQQIDRVAMLHRHHLTSLMTEMGPYFVRWFYQNACSDANTIGYLLCAESDGEILGFVVGHPQPWVLTNRFQRPLHRFARQALLSLLHNPWLVWYILESRWENLSKKVYPADTFPLLYIIVACQAQGQRLGSVLMEQFVIDSRERGYKKVALSVDVDNNQAYSLYKKLGFTVRDRVNQGKYMRDRLELDISTARKIT